MPLHPDFALCAQAALTEEVGEFEGVTENHRERLCGARLRWVLRPPTEKSFTLNQANFTSRKPPGRPASPRPSGKWAWPS